MVLVAWAQMLDGAHADVFDLATDWSTSDNPNGSWSYFDDSSLLPAVASWSGDSWGTPQPGWAAGVGSGPPFMFKSNGTELFSHDWSGGDVVVHADSDTSASSIVFANLSGGSVEADVSGEIWIGRDIGRSIDWSLLDAGGSVLASGTVSSGDAFSAASPMTFSVTDELLAASDELTLVFEKGAASPFGDYVGVNLTITTTAVPEPSSAVLALLASGVAWSRSRRRARSARP